MSEGDALAVMGKIPSKGDFLRFPNGDDSSRAFESWLQSCVERSRGKIPDFHVRFLIRPDESDAYMMGAWIPSYDRVGREFPLVVLQRLPEDVATAPWSVIPFHYAAYLEQAEDCLAHGMHSEFEDVVAGVRAVVQPHPSAIPRALHDGAQLLATARIRAFGERVFGEESSDRLCYALFTLLQATRQQDLTIDFPCTGDLDFYVWLELTRACLGEGQRPGALLWASDGGRGLVALGSPSELLLSFLVELNHSSQRRWPLWTKHSEAEANAREALPLAIRDALDRDVTLEALALLLRAELPS